MDAETLLRLTVLRCAAAPQPAPRSKHHKSVSPPASPRIAVTSDLRMTFVTLWTEHLGRLISINAFLRDTLLFFLPGHWCSEPCSADNLELAPDVEVGSRQFMIRLEQYRIHGGKKQWAVNPFFQHLDKLVSMLEPKLTRAQPLFREWLKGFDRVLTSLHTLLVTVHSAFLSSFCAVDKELSDHHAELHWHRARPSYILAVCDLSRTIDTKLVVITAHTIAQVFDSCSGNVAIQLFRAPANLSADTVAGRVVDALLVRLGDAATSAALNTVFAKTHPQATEYLVSPKTGQEQALAQLRRAVAAYVDKIAEDSAGTPNIPLRLFDSFASPFDSALASHRASRVTASPSLVQEETLASAQPAALQQQPSPYKLRPVSLEDALSLTAQPSSGDPLARFPLPEKPAQSPEEEVRQLIARQRDQARLVFGGAPHGNGNRESWTGLEAAPAAPFESYGQEAASVKQEPPSRRASVASPEVSAQHRSSPKESWLFWHRLRQALGVSVETVSQAMEKCTFHRESPYPNVFLKDLDVRNNDRATRLFLEEVRPLLDLGSPSRMTARNARLFTEACASFAQQLWEKTTELRETLPCLTERVNGVLLGTMYAGMRADKQFESLKQIYLQLSRAAVNGGTPKSATTLANTRTLLIKRAELLAKSLSESDEAPAVANVLGSPRSPSCSGRAGSRRVSELVAEAAASAADGSSVDKPLCGPVGRYAGSSESDPARRRRHSSYTDAAARHGSVVDAVTQSQQRPTGQPAKRWPQGTAVAEVYREACRIHGVIPSPALVRELSYDEATFFPTLDLSNIYVGVKGLRAVLDLLEYNGHHLISLSVSNNSLESDDIAELCAVLKGVAGTNLVHLDLSFNPVAAAAGRVLKDLVATLRCLQTLNTKGTLLPPHTVLDLQKRLEEQRIMRCMRQS